MIGKTKLSCALPGLAILLSGCGAQQYEFDPEWHISEERVAIEEPPAPSGVPDLIGSTAALPELAYEGQADLFDVSVENVSIRQVLTSLADQAQINLDIDPFVDGPVSMSAYGQTLTEILERLSRQHPIRYERVGETLVVMRDEYYTKQYHFLFPDLTRTFDSSIDGESATTGQGSLGESSITSVKTGTGSPWLDLQAALEAITENLAYTFENVGTGPTGLDEDSARELASIELLVERVPATAEVAFVHTIPDAGIIILHGNSQHHKLASDILETMSAATRKQVLLQATVVEILLNNQYQQGIDWSIFNDGNSHPKLLQSDSATYGSALDDFNTLEEVESLREYAEALFGPPAEGELVNPRVQEYVDAEIAKAINNFVPGSSATGGFLSAQFAVGDLQAAVSLLDRFGDTRVVSSPRISTLNNQAAILKVVTDQIFFSVEIERERDDSGVITETYEVEEEVVPVGFVVNVYPQIGNDGTIFLAMRPSISRVIGTALQPTVGTQNAIQSSGVPIVSVKEIDTLMLLNDGQTAVMGGLIEDQVQDATTGVPGLGTVPGIGSLFSNKDERTNRVEYVIFVSAKIVRNPSIYGDYSEYRSLLPSEETLRRDQTGGFFNRPTISVPRSK